MSIATVTQLHPNLSDDERLCVLDSLAGGWQARPEQRFALRILVSTSIPDHGRSCTCGHCLYSMWQVYLHDRALVEGLLDQTDGWWDVDLTLAGSTDPFGLALEIAGDRAQASLKALVQGER